MKPYYFSTPCIPPPKHRAGAEVMIVQQNRTERKPRLLARRGGPRLRENKQSRDYTAWFDTFPSNAQAGGRGERRAAIGHAPITGLYWPP